MAIARMNTAFALDLYPRLRQDEANLLFSPYSISTAMAMVDGGAGGNTAKQIKDMLHVQMDHDQLHPAFGELTDRLTATARQTGQKLSIANGLCLTRGDVSGAYKAFVKENYDAEVFRGSLPEINGWVKQKTEGKIPTILNDLSINSVCVLLNAIYFKGVWESQFEKSRTHDAPFRLSADQQVTAPFMHQKNHYRILNEQDFQAIAIPYRGKRMSMIILLPREVNGLAALENQLNVQTLTQWIDRLDHLPPGQVNLHLPKFRLEAEYDLVPPCKRLGMTDAFDASVADFTGMGWPKGDLWIRQARHKAFVEINEEGAEAAAATAVELETRGVSMPPAFRADHPFLFIIRDDRTDCILFLGRIVNPNPG